jgi:hypothetical protein
MVPTTPNFVTTHYWVREEAPATLTGKIPANFLVANADTYP